MAQLKNETAYRAALGRIDELLSLVNDDTPIEDPHYQELDFISELVEEYENVHYPISRPKLTEVIKLRLYELGITQARLGEMLGISKSRVSDMVSGKCEPSLRVGRELSRQLDIDPAIVLGV